ncbi:thermonuclease family protein [Mesorhizobium sp. M0222]|uniref:thermonuclease family protein n=1 Tax=Mesorhizobium sp. M0222 TaxID=2956921 RepID=UPI00333DB2A9
MAGLVGVRMSRPYRKNPSNRWQRPTGAKLWRRQFASIPAALGLLAVAGVTAFLAPSAAQHSDNVSVASPPKAGRTAAASLTGIASVIDGDTIEIHGQRIRFNGIDAPESRQLCKNASGADYPCGRRSAQALDAFLAASRPVQCTFVTWDRYHRFVGDCRRADGTSVAAWMVEHGQALDWPRYSRAAYAGQQATAKAAKAGLWAGTFQVPWEWRAAHAEGAAPSNRPLGIISRPLVAQSGYSCQPRRTCSQIGSCDEAQWYLQNCSWGGKLDRDGDGQACETLC